MQRCKSAVGLWEGAKVSAAEGYVEGCGLRVVASVATLRRANCPFPGSPFRLYWVGSGLRHDIAVFKGGVLGQHAVLTLPEAIRTQVARRTDATQSRPYPMQGEMGDREPGSW